MDNDDYLRQINERLRESNKHLETINGLLVVVAIFAFLAGRAAVLDYGFLKLIGF